MYVHVLEDDCRCQWVSLCECVCGRMCDITGNIGAGELVIIIDGLYV